jgi:hypothetical protein
MQSITVNRGKYSELPGHKRRPHNYSIPSPLRLGCTINGMSMKMVVKSLLCALGVVAIYLNLIWNERKAKRAELTAAKHASVLVPADDQVTEVRGFARDDSGRHVSLN